MSERLVSPPASPLRYDPSIEHLEKDEAETDAALVEILLKVSNTTFKDGGHALRSVHAKSHGLLRGELRVLDDLPAVLAQGAFAKPGSTYPVVIRLSTTPGDILDDSVSTPRGMALKIVGVEGERLPGTEGDTTQDFVMVNGPAFNAPTAKKFLGNLKLLAATTDKAEGAKKVASAALRGVETLIEAFGHKSVLVTSLGGQRETHILGETFYSQAPLLWGPYIAKVSVAPVSPELTALTDAPLNVNGKPNGIREAVMDFFRQNGGEWELRVQLCTDLDTMPVEDASVVWPEDRSPYVPVARIVVPPQDAWTEARSAAVDDGLAFSPWHGLTAHRPLGSIMRARKRAYPRSEQFRAQHNGCPIREPRTPADLPG
jgi:Catalase